MEKNVYFLDWRLWMIGMHLQHVQMHDDGDNVLLLGICFSGDWDASLHAGLVQACARQRMKSPMTASNITVASSQTSYFACFRVAWKRSKSEANSWEVFEFSTCTVSCLSASPRSLEPPTTRRRRVRERNAASGCSLDFRMVAELRLTRRSEA